MYRGYRYRLYPTPDQEQKFREFAGACRFVYNLALEQRERDWTYWRDAGVRLGFVEQCRQLTDLRKEVPWLEAVTRSCLEQALRDLDGAYVRFFRGETRYPKPRRKGVNDSFRVKGTEVSEQRLSAKWSAVRVPKIGWVKFRDTRPRPGDLRNVTISLDALGWHVSFACEFEAATVPVEGAVGIDRGVANTLALSTGEMVSLPTSLATLDRRYRRAQRVAARRIRGSNRRKAAQKRVAAIAARRARIRRDWHHKTSTAIARRFGTVVMEDLRVVNMTAKGSGAQKRGLNRSILNQGWSAFADLLEYKLKERGGALVLIDPAYTSQQCSECGTIDKANRKSQAAFACQHCGFEAHADTNAAVNILRRNTASMDVEGGNGRLMKRQPLTAPQVRGC